VGLKVDRDLNIKKHILILILIIMNITSYSQSSIGLLYGGTQYRGDLSDDEVGYFKNLKKTIGINYHYSWNKKLNFYTSLLTTSMEAHDKDLSKPGLIQRNLHFKSPLTELSMGFEWYPISFFTKKDFILSPYIKNGVSMFIFNPKAELDGKWHELQPLRTEGQGLPNSSSKPYSLFDVSYPFGVGLSIKMNKSIKLKLEVCPRKTNTDYLDDVSGNYYDLNQLMKYSSDIAARLSYQAINWDISDEVPDIKDVQRGNPTLNDWYIIHQFSINYTFEKVKDSVKEIEKFDSVSPNSK
jgi:hypothetical protein